MSITVLKDVFFACVWFVARFGPMTFVLTVLEPKINPNMYGLGLTFTIALGLVGTATACVVTSTLPHLFYRYASRHQIRSINIDNTSYRQIKLCGVWLFLSTHRRKAPFLSLIRGPFEWQYASRNFCQQTFIEFINEHRNIITSDTHSHMTFIKGEPAK